MATLNSSDRTGDIGQAAANPARTDANASLRRSLAFVFERMTAERALGLVYGLIYRGLLAKMGRGSFISPFIYASGLDCVAMGARSSIHRGTRLLVMRRYGDQVFEPVFQIGDNVSIGLNCTISCVNTITIDDDVTIGDSVYIADSQHEFRDIRKGIREQPLIVGEVRIGKAAWIGYGSVLAGDVVVGEHAVIGANSVVKTNVEPYTAVAGAPARVVSRYSFVSLAWESVGDTPSKPAAAALAGEAPR